MTGIRAGQFYTACDPRQNGLRIVVRSYVPGDGRVLIETAEDGRTKRPRWISARALHPSAQTATGADRRTGYALVSRWAAWGCVDEDGEEYAEHHFGDEDECSRCGAEVVARRG
ncbi:hypothetical protein [Streptomyces sp. NPDC014733]|uniref:hypothetical protein n=1 Tax=Streptomyces sp. NPDC014733 TaxID=3364885 RepID=UPI0036F52C34